MVVEPKFFARVFLSQTHVAEDEDLVFVSRAEEKTA